jgi:hypothetical protein
MVPWLGVYRCSAFSCPTTPPSQPTERHLTYPNQPATVARMEPYLQWLGIQLMELGGTAMSLLLLLVLAASPLQQARAVGGGRPRVPAILVFGDSIVDTGNNNAVLTLTKSNFRPYGKDLNGGVPTGRFSNGRIPTDFVGSCPAPLAAMRLEHEPN